MNNRPQPKKMKIIENNNSLPRLKNYYNSNENTAQKIGRQNRRNFTLGKFGSINHSITKIKKILSNSQPKKSTQEKKKNSSLTLHASKFFNSSKNSKRLHTAVDYQVPSSKNFHCSDSKRRNRSALLTRNSTSKNEVILKTISRTKDEDDILNSGPSSLMQTGIKNNNKNKFSSVNLSPSSAITNMLLNQNSPKDKQLTNIQSMTNINGSDNLASSEVAMEAPRKNQLAFKIKSNWGNNTTVSMFNLKLYDKSNKVIPIMSSNSELSNGKTWYGKYIKGKEIQLYFSYEEKTGKLAKIGIMNAYNEVGIKHLEIKLNGNHLWKGVVPKASNLKEFFINLSGRSKTIKVNRFGNTNNQKKRIRKQIEDIFQKDQNEGVTFVKCNKVKLCFISNYGDKKIIGLSGIEFYDINDKIIHPKTGIKMIKNNAISFSRDSKNNVDNLINSKNETTNGKLMFASEKKNLPVIDIVFATDICLKKIVIYNYNVPSGLECATRELLVNCFKDSLTVLKNKKLILLKPPGEEGINYSQTFVFPFSSNIESSVEDVMKQILNYEPSISKTNEELAELDYITPKIPCGFILTIQLTSTWGDKENIGIDHIDILDYKGDSISEKAKIYLFPEKALLSNAKAAPLLLSPFQNLKKIYVKPKKGNRMIIIFESFAMISEIKIMNYTKIPKAGAKEIKIFLDGNIIYEGECNIGGETSINFSLTHDSITKRDKEDPWSRYEVIEGESIKILQLKGYE